MSRFTEALVIRTGGLTAAGRSEWRTVGPLVWEVGELGSGHLITVPDGFLFDLSAPAWATPFLPRKQMRRPSALHDYCRKDLGKPLWWCDLQWLDACHAEGIREPLLTACWLAVRTSNRRD